MAAVYGGLPLTLHTQVGRPIKLANRRRPLPDRIYRPLEVEQRQEAWSGVTSTVTMVPTASSDGDDSSTTEREKEEEQRSVAEIQATLLAKWNSAVAAVAAGGIHDVRKREVRHESRGCNGSCRQHVSCELYGSCDDFGCGVVHLRSVLHYCGSGQQAGSSVGPMGSARPDGWVRLGQRWTRSREDLRSSDRNGCGSTRSRTVTAPAETTGIKNPWSFTVFYP